MINPYMWGYAQQQNQQNPWLSLLGGALPGLGGAVGALFDTPQDKFMKWSLMQRQALMKEFGRRDRGPVISPYQMQLMGQMNKRAMAPQFAQMLRTASRSGAGMSSPQTYNAYNQSWMPMLANYMNQLQTTNIGLTQRRNQFLDSIMAGLVG